MISWLGGRDLLLQCLPGFFERPGIFHREHGLHGKVLHEPDLAVCERLHVRAVKIDDPNDGSIVEQWPAEQGCAAPGLTSAAVMGTCRR